MTSFFHFYDVCRFFFLQRENTGAGICSDEILLSGNCPQNSGKVEEEECQLWIMREADFMMSIRTNL